VCVFFLSRKDKLKQHAAKHTASGGLFKCHACVKTFVRPEHLRDHDIVRHSRRYPFRYGEMFPRTPNSPNTALITTLMKYTRENSHE
jgi:hypothetical protein